jgi:putative acetyltransferase
MIRAFRPADAAGTWRVFYDAVRIGAAGHYTETELIDWAPSDQMPDGWGAWLHQHVTYVGESDGTVENPDTRIIGFFMLEGDGYLNMAFVSPDYRGSGLAQQLYAAILAEAQALALPRMTVIASRMFAPFLRRAGWVDDPDPPPRDGHPILPADPKDPPIEWTLKLDLTGRQ